MSDRLFGLIPVRGELDRMERANQIFFHAYTTLTFFVPCWLVTFNSELNIWIKTLWQLTFILLVCTIPFLGKRSLRLFLWAIPTTTLLISALAVLIVRPTQGNGDLPLTLITLSVVLYTSSTFRGLRAYVLIGFALLAELVLLQFGSQWFAARGGIVHTIPVAVIFHAAIGVLVSAALNRSRKQAGTLDEALAELVSVKSSIDDMSQRENDRRSRLQRIHGDVLNTLIGVANWSGEVSAQLAESCKRAILLSSEATPPQGGSLRKLVDGCLRKLDTRDFKIRLSATADVVLPQASLLAVRAIVEECISNSVRHSQGTLISIGWRVTQGNQVEIWLEDDGVGIPEIFSPRLGWSEVIYPAIQRLGGTSATQNLADSGVRISFTFTYSVVTGIETSSLELLRNTFKEQDTFQDHAMSWASQCIAYILLILTPVYLWSETNWRTPAIIAGALFLYMTVLLRVPKLHTFSTNLGAMLMACGLLLAAAKGIPGCSSAPSLQWFANIAGTIFLAGVYRFGFRAILVQFPLFVLTALYVGSQLSSVCVQVISVPLYGVGIYGIAAASHSVANARRRRLGEDALKQFTGVTTLEERRLEQRVRDEDRWQDILKETNGIFSNVVEGEYLDSQLRRSASLQDARLRAHLQIEAMNQPRIFGVTGRLIDRITHQNLVPTLQVGTFSDEEIDASELDFLGPEEVVDLLTGDLEKFNDQASLYIERRLGNVFLARISGETRVDLDSECILGAWKYKSTSPAKGFGSIEITVAPGGRS
ncbi:MAG: hypothetical protein F2718_03175 [Actinobacteria bacterium]|uniref:Unannotated protein n=1 Tax=freshwater metagenome TaxID=449393 RepID=A0A6J6VMG3_9ZZZZ|nr:hypothetical protein [Actinomycetota bacterium]